MRVEVALWAVLPKLHEHLASRVGLLNDCQRSFLHVQQNKLISFITLVSAQPVMQTAD